MEHIRAADIFCGIGAFRQALNAAGCQCVFSSDIDKYAQETYCANYGDLPQGDIREVGAKEMPDFDLLAAGFPCPTFSSEGVSKRLSLGMDVGFDDDEKGKLFFELTRIIDAKRPKAIVLENVKNLLSADKGRVIETIVKVLRFLGYAVRYSVVDARFYVPQHRERTFIVAFRKAAWPHVDWEGDWFQFPTFPANAECPTLRSILEEKVDDKYTLSDKMWGCLLKHAARHKGKGNGFGYGLADLDGVTRTLKARYYKDGSEILVPQEGRNPRRLTPRECARLMGFSEDFKIVVSDSQAYKQFGNSIVVPVATEMVRRVVDAMRKMEEQAHG